MAKTTTVDKFDKEIEAIMSDYSMNIAADVQDAVELVTKAGAREVQRNARAMFGGSGKYARGWKGETERDRIGAVGVIYNKTVPGLPHLLEYGHAKRDGGRVAGRAHIKPTEEKIVKQFEERVVINIT